MMSTRVQKIKQTCSKQLEIRLKQENVTILLDSVWDILTSADPTKNKKNVRWMVETYINKGYLWEDISSGATSKVAETLIEFDKHKRNLEPTDRSLTKYQTLGALWNAIKPYVGQLTANEEKREERDKAYSEAEVVVDREDGLKIIVPLTEYASKWFGRGTRWCTAAEKNNRFKQYAMSAPLFIIFMPDGDKLQLWKYENGVQFMDDNDDSVPKEYIEEHWDILEPICIWTKELERVPEKRREREICLEAVKNNGMALAHVPEELQDYEMCLEAVKQNGMALTHVPRNLIDRKMCLMAVKQNGIALRYVPEELQDRGMSLEAVKRDGRALQFVPDEYRDKEMCMEAVKNNGMALRYVPEKLQDYEMCLEAVKHKGCVLMHIRKKLIDYEMCLQAVKQNGNAFKYVPEELQDYEIYMEAVKNAGIVLFFIPEEFRSKEICMEAVKNDGMALAYVPEHFQDREICLEAVKQYELASHNKDKKINDIYMKQISEIMLFYGVSGGI